MRAPKKVIAAMAIATMIGGTGAVKAFAAEPDFKTTAGALNSNPVQTTDKENATTAPNNASQGQIIVTGTFNKNVSTLPEITKDGHYLRVTMPISLDYSYNVDTDEMLSGEGKVINESVYVTGTPDAKKETKQAVNMTFVGMNGISDPKIQYVSQTTSEQNIVQLPFELVVTKNGKDAKKIHLADLVNPGENKEQLKIEPGTSVNFKIDRISGQNVNNGKQLLKDGQKVSNNITLKFEYLGK